MAHSLLAGPILRRTTNNRVCVWLATENERQFRLSILDLNGNTLGSSELLDLRTSRYRLGENLYVYLLQARPTQDQRFPCDQLLRYQIIELIEGAEHPLNLSSLAYGSLGHPSFFIPTQLKRILHGSCRKPHGGFGEHPDALSHGHTLLEKTHADLSLRPALALLTGDQMYADDVAISLLARLRQVAPLLTGKLETLPTEGAALNPTEIHLHGRQFTLEQQSAGFSSTEAHNHLFAFGEFAAMYLYTFGNTLGWEPTWDWASLQAMGVANPEAAKAAWAKQEMPLRTFHKTLPDIRKLLANIPTYMIFDDHDVTDDWNITGYWYDQVRNSPLGRRVVSNALAAYWAFQAWGNDPDNFDKDLVFTITQQLNCQTVDPDTGERFDLHTWKSRGWGFSISSKPPIIALDTRTQRRYENKYYPPLLMDRYALDWLRVEWAKLKTGQTIDRDTCPIIIAPAPVFGFNTIEFLQQAFLWLSGLLENWQPIQYLEKLTAMEGYLTGKVVNALDAESWMSNKEGFVALMETLGKRMGISQCTFLSGDVHYGFTTTGQFSQQDYTLQYCQMTSSALNNHPDDKQSRFLEHAAGHGTGLVTHHNWSLFPSQRWTATVQLESAGPLRVSPHCNMGLIEFADNGRPVHHTLLRGSGELTYGPLK